MAILTQRLRRIFHPEYFYIKNDPKIALGRFNLIFFRLLLFSFDSAANGFGKIILHLFTCF
jgi:hypothetical protein